MFISDMILEIVIHPQNKQVESGYINVIQTATSYLFLLMPFPLIITIHRVSH